ncbi:MAG: class I SAM-dependent methyltransferase [Actinomycetales bacterium]
MTEHYFTERPSSERDRKSVALRLRGHDVTVSTEAGVFSHERVDLGTQVLLRYAPDLPAQGDLLDLGCGWGALTIAMALDSPQATVWAVDVNERALSLTADNAAGLGLSRVRTGRPDQVPPDVEFATIWSNPPIRVGKEALHSLLRQWLPRLAVGGVAHLVVQRNLGADSLHAWLTSALAEDAAREYDVSRIGSAKGYRVLEVRRRS